MTYFITIACRQVARRDDFQDGEGHSRLGPVPGQEIRRDLPDTALTALAQLRTAAIQSALAGASLLAAPPAAPAAVSEPAISEPADGIADLLFSPARAPPPPPPRLAQVRDHYSAQLVATDDIADDVTGSWDHILGPGARSPQISPPQIPKPTEQKEGGYQCESEYWHEEASQNAAGQSPLLTPVIHDEGTVYEHSIHCPGQGA